MKILKICYQVIKEEKRANICITGVLEEKNQSNQTNQIPEKLEFKKCCWHLKICIFETTNCVHCALIKSSVTADF